MAGNEAVNRMLSLQRQTTSEVVITVGLSKAQLARARAFYAARRHRYSADLIRAIQRAVGVPEDPNGKVTDETIVAVADKQEEFGPPLKRDGMAGPRTLGRLFPTGLADAATAAGFAADVEGTTLDAATWGAVGTAQGRADRLVADVATPLAAADVGVAPTARADQDLGVNAVFVHEDWEIHFDIDRMHLAKSSLTKSEATDITTGVYHEARHAEQYHKMARMLAAKGVSEAGIIRQMELHTENARAVAKEAINNPLTRGSPEFLVAEDQFDAELGSGKQHHLQVQADVVAAAKAFELAKRRQDREPTARNAEALASAQAKLDKAKEAHDAESTETDAILTEREVAAAM